MSAVATKEKPQSTEALVVQLEELADNYGPQALAPLSTIARSVKLAEGVRQARQLVAGILPHIRHLAGSSLGFRTDKDRDGKSGYDDATLAEALTEGVLRGVSWTGNELNIISGRCYITKEGYAHLVREIAGLTDLVLIPGVPKGAEGGAVVPFKASWRLNGRPMSLERQIPVRLNSGMGADGAIGKATRKMLASIFFQCTGSAQSAADAEDDPTEPGEAAPVPGRAVELREKMLGGPAVAKPESETPQPADGKLFADGGVPVH